MDALNRAGGRAKDSFFFAAEKIYLTLRAGGTRKDAHVRASVPLNTFYDWVRRGREGREPYRTFVDTMEQIETDFKLGLLGLIAKAAAGDRSANLKPKWVAAAWILERRYGSEFAKIDEDKVISELLRSLAGVETKVAEVMLRHAPEAARGEITREIAKIFSEVRQ